MKVRTGFVSNSSSSSFVVITTKKAHEDVLSNMADFEREVIKQLIVKEQKLANLDIVVLGVYQSAGDWCTLETIYTSDVPEDYTSQDLDNEDYEEPQYIIWNKYQSLLASYGQIITCNVGDEG